MTRTLTVGTRTSRLARWQTDRVVHLLQQKWPDLDYRIEPFVTKGDKTLAKPLPEIGGKGLFTFELEQALREGRIDIAVHSLKDLPVANAPGLTLGAITDRADVRDGLVARNGWILDTLPEGAVVGTSSLRRQAQLLALRPDLTVRSIRGNVGTRIRKALEGDYDATLLAAAGVRRLGLTDAVTEWLSLEQMLPAPGQAALAVQCRADDEQTLELLATLNSEEAQYTTVAERSFLQGLGGGCSAPIAAFATRNGNGGLSLQGLIAAPDGERLIRLEATTDDYSAEAAEALGKQLAQEARARGAQTILEAVASERPVQLTAAPRALANKSVVVTRPPHQAKALADLLREQGANPVLFPTIEIRPMPDSSRLDQAIQNLQSYDWVVFTSVNGVAMFWDRLEALGLNLLQFDGVQVAAIGPATADALAERGVEANFVPDEFVAERIAEGIGDVGGLHILLPRAEIARKTLTEMLEAQGAEVDEVASYRTLPAAPDAAALDRLANVDIITFTSSSTVRNFVDLVGGPQAAVRLAAAAKVACIGPITAGTATELGLEPIIVADEYTMEGLVAALVAYYQNEQA